MTSTALRCQCLQAGAEASSNGQQLAMEPQLELRVSTAWAVPPRQTLESFCPHKSHHSGMVSTS